MTALWIVLILLLIGMIPVGAWIRYSDGEVLAKAAIGPIKFKVYPPAPLHGKKLAKQHAKKLEKERAKQRKKAGKKRKQAEEKRRKAEEKRKKKEKKRKTGKENQVETGENREETGQAKAKKKGAKAKKKKPEKKRKPKKKLSLEELLPIVKLALKVVGDLPRRLILRELRLHVVCGGADAARAAAGYGRAWAAVGAAVPALERCFRIQKRDVGVALDYGRESVGIDALLDIRMRIGTAVLLALDAGVRFAAILVKNKFKHHKQYKSKGGAAA